MTDDLTADDLRRLAADLDALAVDLDDVGRRSSAIAARRVARELADLTPPPLPGTVTLPASVVRALLPESQGEDHEAALVARRALASNGRDWLAAASDPRVVAVYLARKVTRNGVSAEWLQDALRREGFTATEDQARALLDAVAAWERGRARALRHRHAIRARLDAAVTAIVGEQP